MSIIIEAIPFFQTNYAWLLYDDITNKAVVVDPGDFNSVHKTIKDKALDLQFILITHFHSDHTGGVYQLKENYNCQIIAPLKEEKRIPEATIYVQNGKIIDIGMDKVTIIETPGHTAGSVCYFLPNLKAIFTGDTLFSLGCGRLFEGSPQQMYASLQQLKALPDDSLVYAAHEYTEDNGRFALTIYPDNDELKKRIKQVEISRKQNQPSLPVLLSIEKKTNPFLLAQTVEEFARFRVVKDHFV